MRHTGHHAGKLKAWVRNICQGQPGIGGCFVEEVNCRVWQPAVWDVSFGVAAGAGAAVRGAWHGIGLLINGAVGDEMIRAGWQNSTPCSCLKSAVQELDAMVLLIPGGTKADEDVV